jgi:hypothetical protein
MSYTNNVNLVLLGEGEWPQVSARLWMLTHPIGDGNQQMELEITTVQATSDFAISFNRGPDPIDRSHAIGLSLQRTTGVGHDSGWLFRSGRFDEPLPTDPIEVVVGAHYEITGDDVPSLFPSLPFTVDSDTVITQFTAELVHGGIDLTLTGTTKQTGVVLGFRYTGTMVLTPSSDVAAAESEALSIWVRDPQIAFLAGPSVLSSVEAWLFNVMDVFIMRDLAPKVKKNLERRVNSSVLASAGRQLAGTDLPPGVILSIAWISIDPNRIMVTPALGAFGGVFSKLPPLLPSSGRCFIATAAYGSSLAPEVDFLRHFRDDVLRKTRSGAEFFDRYYEQYYQISPPIADQMWRDQGLRHAIRWSLVRPIVSQLQLALHFPDADIDMVVEPWRSFLTELRKGLEEWAEAIELPYSFDGLMPMEAAEEIRVVMRYLLRRHETRSAYLDRLEALSQLPLDASSHESEEIAEHLRSSGRSEAEIRRILGRNTPSDRAGAQR